MSRLWKGIPLPHITTEKVRELLSAHAKYSPATQSLYHRLLSVFFNFAVRQEWILKNPVQAVAAPKIPPKRPEVFTNEQVVKIMDAALNVAPESVPYSSLCFFAGIRPETAERLSWEHIGKEKISIVMELSKTPYDYEVPIRPNLAAWLALTPPEKRVGRIFPACNNTLRGGIFRKVRKASGVKWIRDGARHQFASCVCALDGVESAVAQMGHKSPTMLYRHYRTLIDKETASAFFEIKPKQVGVVLSADRAFIKENNLPNSCPQTA